MIYFQFFKISFVLQDDCMKKAVSKTKRNSAQSLRPTASETAAAQKGVSGTQRKRIACVAQMKTQRERIARVTSARGELPRVIRNSALRVTTRNCRDPWEVARVILEAVENDCTYF